MFYLTDRSYFIHIGSESSAVTDCSYGVPLISVLRPLFIVAYISSVACIGNKFSVFLSQYADNSQLYIALSKKAVCDAVTNLQNCLFDVIHILVKMDSSSTWKNLRRCSRQVSTTQHARALSLPLTNINVTGCIVPLTDTVKLLGVTIYRHLTFDFYVRN